MKCNYCRKDFINGEKYYHATSCCDDYGLSAESIISFVVCKCCINKLVDEFKNHILGTDKSKMDKRLAKDVALDELDINECTFDKSCGI